MTTQARLCNDDFKALRSLARGRWGQGRAIAWKINRTWSCVPLSDAALDAAFRLVAMGLVENFVCCPACGEVFQLTQAGQARASQIDCGPVTNVDHKAPQIETQRPSVARWIHRLGEHSQHLADYRKTEVTTILFKTVKVPLPALMIAIFGLGLLVGIFLGAAAYESGAAKSDEKWRLEDAKKPAYDKSIFCTPPVPVSD